MTMDYNITAHLLGVILLDIVKKGATGWEKETEGLENKCSQWTRKFSPQHQEAAAIAIGKICPTYLVHRKGHDGEEPNLAAGDPPTLRVAVHHGADGKPGFALAIALGEELGVGVQSLAIKLAAEAVTGLEVTSIGLSLTDLNLF